MKLSGFTMLI